MKEGEEKGKEKRGGRKEKKKKEEKKTKKMRWEEVGRGGARRSSKLTARGIVV